MSDMGGGGSRQKMAMCDKGEGLSKIAILGVTYFLNHPKQTLEILSFLTIILELF